MQWDLCSCRQIDLTSVVQHETRQSFVNQLILLTECFEEFSACLPFRLQKFAMRLSCFIFSVPAYLFEHTHIQCGWTGGPTEWMPVDSKCNFHRFSPLVCLHCVPCAELASTEYSGINDTTSVYIDWKLVYLLAQITIIPLAFDRIIDVLHVALIVDETFGIIEKIACAPNAHSMVNMHRTCHQLQLSSIPRCQPLNQHTHTSTYIRQKKKRSKKVVTDLDAARMGITVTEYGIKYAYFMN